MKSFSGIIFTLMFTALLFSTSALIAQDTIHTINRKKIIAKVIQINNKDISYKKFSHLEGPIYRIDIRDVVKIVFANGVVDIFNQKLSTIPEPVYIPPPPPKYDPRGQDYYRNFVYLTVTDLFMGLISVGYERTAKSGKSSIRIPISFGMSSLGITKTVYDNKSPLSPVFPSGGYYFKNKIYSTGFELNAFPDGQGTVKYFLGPSVEYGRYHYYTYNGVPGEPGNYTLNKVTSPIFTIMFKNGVMIQPTKKFNLVVYFGLGTLNLAEKQYSRSSGDYYYSNSLLKYASVELGINAGYKF